MNKLIPFVALVAAIVNAARKVINKLAMVGQLYSKAWGGMSSLMMTKYGISTEDFNVSIAVTIPLRGTRKIRLFYTWWDVSIPLNVPGGVTQYSTMLEQWGDENIVCGRLGPNVKVALHRSIPSYAYKHTGDGYILNKEYSVPFFARSHGMTPSQAYEILREFAIGCYRKMQLDGLYPQDIFL